MEPSIWEMQQEAARRVEYMRQVGRRAAENPPPPVPEPRRSASSLRANRPPPYRPLNHVSPPRPAFYPESGANHNLPPHSQNLPPHSQKSPDREQLLLLALTLLLAKNGGSPQLILALLYLAF